MGIFTILYCIMRGAVAEIHTNVGTTYKTRMKFDDIKNQLGDNFIKIHLGCLVSALTIHEISDKIVLSNGEGIEYAIRRKKDILDEFHTAQKRIIDGFNHEGVPATTEKIQRILQCLRQYALCLYRYRAYI